MHGDVAWFDAGELSVASVGLGVPHPTGFPLLTLTGYAAHLVPIGTLPFRLALVSSASLAASTGLIAEIATRNGARPLAAVAGAALFPATFAVWVNGMLFEVYALNALCIAWLALLLLRPEPRFRAAALLTGLGLGAHATFVLTAAVLWGFTLLARGAARRIPALLPWAVAGALVIVYLPLAASRDPFLNWGDPATLEGLWRHLSAAGIRESFAGEIGAGGASAWHAAGVWTELAGGLFFWGALAFSLASVWWVRPRWLWGALVSALVVDGLFSTFINPMGQDALQTGMPGALALALLVALGAGTVPRRFRSEVVVPALVALVVLLTAWQRVDDRPADDMAGVSARFALAQLGPNSTALVTSDHLASQFLYLQGVEGMRRDALVLVTQHLADPAATLSRFAHARRSAPAGFEQPVIATGDQLDRVLALLRHEVAVRPVYYELGDGRFDPALREALLPHAWLFRVAADRTTAAAAAQRRTSWALVLGRLARERTPRFRTRRAFSDGARLLGAWRILRGELAAGAAACEEAVGLDATNPRALVNLAAARRRQGRPAEAMALLEQALELAPSYERARENLARYRAEDI